MDDKQESKKDAPSWDFATQFFLALFLILVCGGLGFVCLLLNYPMTRRRPTPLVALLGERVTQEDVMDEGNQQETMKSVMRSDRVGASDEKTGVTIILAVLIVLFLCVAFMWFLTSMMS